MKRLIVIGIILLFLFCNISFTTLSDEDSGNLSGKTLYVGGSGEGNYTKIQDAINDSSDGDTVFVYNGTYYLGEGLIYINKSIELRGESRDETIITSNNYSVLYINTNNVGIFGFTFEKVTLGGGPVDIDETSSYNNIELINNRINSSGGLLIILCINVTVKGNIFSPYNGEGYIGIFSAFNSNVKIENNEISGFANGMFVTDGNTVKNNLFRDNVIGISAWLDSTSSYPCIISKNNFIQNKIQAEFNFFYSSKLFKYLPLNLKNNLINELRFKNIQSFQNKIFSKHIIWNENYWDDWMGFGPKLISGSVVILVFIIPWFNLDWFPAKAPYEIKVN